MVSVYHPDKSSLEWKDKNELLMKALITAYDLLPETLKLLRDKLESNIDKHTPRESLSFKVPKEIGYNILNDRDRLMLAIFIEELIFKDKYTYYKYEKNDVEEECKFKLICFQISISGEENVPEELQEPLIKLIEKFIRMSVKEEREKIMDLAKEFYRAIVKDDELEMKELNTEIEGLQEELKLLNQDIDNIDSKIKQNIHIKELLEEMNKKFDKQNNTNKKNATTPLNQGWNNELQPIMLGSSLTEDGGINVCGIKFTASQIQKFYTIGAEKTINIQVRESMKFANFPENAELQIYDNNAMRRWMIWKCYQAVLNNEDWITYTPGNTFYKELRTLLE